MSFQDEHPPIVITETQLPEDLQHTQEELNEFAELGEDPPLAVMPTVDELMEMETAMERMLNDVFKLKAVRERISAFPDGLKTPTARAVSLAVENLYSGRLHISGEAAFTGGAQAAQENALIRVVSREASTIETFWRMFKSWARSIYLWFINGMASVKSIDESLSKVKPSTGKIPTATVSQDFMMRHLVPWKLIDEGRKPSNLITDAIEALRESTKYLNDCMKDTGSMFRETPNTQHGTWGGPTALSTMVAFFSKNAVYNPQGYGGSSLIVAPAKYHTHQGGDTDYTFEVTRQSYPTLLEDTFRVYSTEVLRLNEAVRDAIRDSKASLNTIGKYAEGISRHSNVSVKVKWSGAPEVEVNANLSAMFGAMTLARGLREVVFAHHKLLTGMGKDCLRFYKTIN